MNNFSLLLEGGWQIKGTNFPLWISEKRKNPMITYKKVSDNPLKFLDIVQYEKGNKTKQIIGVDTYNSNMFIWRGRGLLKILKSKWSILKVTETILVIKFERSFVTPSGVDILIRNGIEVSDEKQFILSILGDQIFTTEELESLTWL